MSPMSRVTARSFAIVSLSFALLGSLTSPGVIPRWSPCRSIPPRRCGASDVEAAIAVLTLRSAASFVDAMVPGRADQCPLTRHAGFMSELTLNVSFRVWIGPTMSQPTCIARTRGCSTGSGKGEKESHFIQWRPPRRDHSETRFTRRDYQIRQDVVRDFRAGHLRSCHWGCCGPP